MNKLIFLFFAIVLLSACGTATPEATATPTSTPKETPTVLSKDVEGILVANGFERRPFRDMDCVKPCRAYTYSPLGIDATVFLDGNLTFKINNYKPSDNSKQSNVYNKVIQNTFGEDAVVWIANNLQLALNNNIGVGSLTNCNVSLMVGFSSTSATLVIKLEPHLY